MSTPASTAKACPPDPDLRVRLALEPGHLPVQFLTPEGELTEPGRAADVDLDVVRAHYTDMLLARRFDEEAFALQRQGELGLWLRSLGQEAAQVGSIRALDANDWVFPSYRDHAAALCRGIQPAQLLAQWRGSQHAGWDPQDHRFHIYSLVLGSQTLHATGFAMGVLADGVDEVVMTYFGDGAASEGDVSEALNFAGVADAPVVFFCQNNQWAISTPTSAQTRTPLHLRAAGYGLDSYLVDGNDVLAVHAVTRAAVERTRGGGGPSFIEAVTYRIAGHSTSDDPSKYRPDVEVDPWRRRDPLTRVELLLRSTGTSNDFFQELDLQADALAVTVREGCLSMPDPEPASMFDNVYVDEHPLVEAERAAFAAYTASFEGGH